MKKEETENNLIIQSMMSMGLTEMESRIYMSLLSENPTTGYKIAKALQKPVANIYKSLLTMENKGIVLVEEDSKKMYRPITLNEFLNLLEKRFASQKGLLKNELVKIEKRHVDEKVYQLKSVEHLYEKVRGMLRKTKKIALIDMFPEILSEFRQEISDLAARDVKVLIKAYAPISIPQTEIIPAPNGQIIIQDYPGEWIKVSVDGKEHLTGLLSKGCKEVHQAIWSSSSFLSLINHFGMSSEISLDRIQHLAEKDDHAGIKSLLTSLCHKDKYNLPGYIDLVKKFSRQ